MKIPEKYRESVERLERSIAERIKGVPEPYEVKVYLWDEKALEREGLRISEVSIISKRGSTVSGLAYERNNLECQGVILAAEDVLLAMHFGDPPDELERCMGRLQWHLSPSNRSP